MVFYDDTVEAVERIEAIAGESFLHLDDPNPETNLIISHRRIFSSFHQDGHDAWTALYSSNALYLWHLQQRLKSK